jgi:WD40 repeat protein/tRNA A-37 threonylcarbamoyl transferase component Bud32
VGEDLPVSELVSRWLERRRQGQTLSLQELCADVPENAEGLRQHLRAVAEMESFLGARTSGAECPPSPPLSPAGANEPMAESVNLGSAITPLGQQAPETRTGLPWPAAGPAPLPGSVAVPGYELLGELGRGGMGVVYKARQIKLNRVVALKMILAGGHAGAADLARFVTEAEAIARLQHPNIVQLYEVGEHGGLPYFSLEFCPGGSLDRKLGGTPLPPRQAAALVETLARAMQAAHEKGVVHRDLKPANVLVAEDGTPKVTDFGLAKKLGEAAGQTASGAVLGTPSYMAPEQALGKAKAVGPAADVYALGAILYELLTGRPPFKAATTWDTVQQVVNGDPAAPSRLQPNLPRDLETVCLKCLQKDPDRRYPSAADLADDLRRFQTGESIRARPVGYTERTWRWCLRNPWVAASLAAVLLAWVTGFGLVLAQWREAVRQRDRADGQTRLALEAREEANANALGQANARVEAEQQRDRADQQARQATSAREAASANALGQMRARKEAEQAREAAQVAQRRAERELRRVEVARYALQLAWAQRELEVGNLGTANKILSACPPELCRWEHLYLRQLARPRSQNVFDKAARPPVHESPDAPTRDSHGPPASRVIALSADERIPADINRVGRQVVSPGGKLVVARTEFRRSPPPAGMTSLIEVRDGGTGKSPSTFSLPHFRCVCVAISPDEKVIACSGRADGEKSQVILIDAQSGKQLLALRGESGVTALAFSTDSTRLAGGGGGTVRVWDLKTGKPLFTLGRHHNTISCVCFSPDGAFLASAEGAVPDEHRYGVQGIIGTVEHPAYEIKVWSMQTGREVQTLRGHSGDVYTLAFSPDGSRLASAGKNRAVDVWEPTTGRLLAVLEGCSDPVRSVAFDAAGTRLVAFDGSTAQVWDSKPSAEPVALKGHTAEVLGVAFSPDGHRIASTGRDGTVRLWDTGSGRELVQLGRHEGGAFGVAFSPDGSCLASAGADGAVKLWDVRGGKGPLILAGHAGAVMAVDFSPDGSVVVSAGRDGTVRAWDVTTGRQIRRLDTPEGGSFAVAFSPDGGRIAAGCDHVVRAWQVATWRELPPLRGHTGLVNNVRFLAGGTQLVSAGDDKTIRIWDLQMAAEVDRLRGHADAVEGLAVSPDGERIASCSDDKLLKLWDRATGQELLSLKAHTYAACAVAWSKDGKQLASAGADHTIRIWKVESAPPK